MHLNGYLLVAQLLKVVAKYEENCGRCIAFASVRRIDTQSVLENAVAGLTVVRVNETDWRTIGILDDPIEGIVLHFLLRIGSGLLSHLGDGNGRPDEFKIAGHLAFLVPMPEDVAVLRLHPA